MRQQRFVTIRCANQATAQIECLESIAFPDLTKKPDNLRLFDFLGFDRPELNSTATEF